MEGAFVAVMRFVAYLRVSTDKQGKAGLGIEAQRELVKRHLGDARPIYRSLSRSSRASARIGRNWPPPWPRAGLMVRR